MKLFGDQCSFKHTDISELFNVQPMPIEDLPKVCTCGAALTYADEVAFVNQVTPEVPPDEVVVTTPVTTESLLSPLFRPKERPLDEACPECGAKSLVAVQAAAWGAWGGAVVCKACSYRTSVPNHVGHQVITVEPLEPVEAEPAQLCPRCSSPVQVAEQLGEVCTRCTWPNPSFVRMKTTLAKREQTALGYSMTDQALEDFAASLKSETVLKDPKGRFGTAKVFEVHVHDGQVDVTFEFDPLAWQVP